MLNFALTGAAGYVAPRHMQAIQDTGNNLVAVLDPHDTLGVMYRYFPAASCFSSEEMFARYIHAQGIDYLTVCSPNHIHFDHIKMGLASGAHVICEKPVVIDPSQLKVLEGLENQYQRKINTILQLRLLPAVIALKESLRPDPSKHQVKVRYITSRGNWYHHSWKGQDNLSGGLVTNIGVHLFDLLIWLFGATSKATVRHRTATMVQGVLELERATVNWMLSIDANDLPAASIAAGKRTFRTLEIDGEEYKLDDGLEGLHTQSYKEILKGEGLGLREAAPSIQLCHHLMQL